MRIRRDVDRGRRLDVLEKGRNAVHGVGNIRRIEESHVKSPAFSRARDRAPVLVEDDVIGCANFASVTWFEVVSQIRTWS